MQDTKAMETSILEQLNQIQRLIGVLQHYADSLEKHIGVCPKQKLEDSVCRGFPVEVSHAYYTRCLLRREIEVRNIVSYINGVCVPYLEYVAGRLRQTLDRMGNVSARSLSVADFGDFRECSDPLSRNRSDIERALGITCGRRMSIEEADKQNTNPNYDKSHEYRVNCATCAAAYVLRLRGFDVKAKGNPETDGNLNTWLSECHSFDIWNNPDGTKATPIYTREWMEKNGIEQMSPQDYRMFFEQSCKERGVYILTLAWKGGGGHATILQRDDDGRLYYIEPQLFESFKGESGRRSLEDLVYELSPVQPPEKGIMRVDDKVFNVKYAPLFST